MATKPEARFVNGVHRYLRGEVHHESLYSPYVRGRPDQYYESFGGIILIEYKYISRIPPNVYPALSTLQEQWIKRAYKHGIKTAVIVGYENHGYIYTNPDDWYLPVSRDDFIRRSMSQIELATWITNQVKHD
jgi:hypothetical protein